MDILPKKQKEKPPCKYGQKCYRKNPDHLRDFSHPKINTKSDKDDDNDNSDTDAGKKMMIVSEEKGINESTAKTRIMQKRLSSSSESGKTLKRRRTEENLPLSPKTLDDKEDESALSNENEDISNHNSLDEEEESLSSSPEDVKENIKMKFLVEMPQDFYHFWEFCLALNSSDPQSALKCLNLQLVGPYDILVGKHKKITKNKYGRRPNFLLHYRFYYDPPEFQTVLVSQDKDSLHFGYFRDDPTELPVFVASNSPGSSSHKEKITQCGENLFAAIHIYATKKLKSGVTPFEKVAIQKLVKKLEDTASKHDLELVSPTKRMKERQKKVVCPSFHGAGIVVPVDENDVGYRPVPETPADLRAILKRISEAETEQDKDRHLEALQELITLVQFANDECDYGEGLELGMDLFSYGGEVFHPQISILLPLAYQLLNRPQFASILTAHLERRSHIDQCVNELAV